MRNVLFCLWTCRDVGIVPAISIMAGVRRLRITYVAVLWYFAEGDIWDNQHASLAPTFNPQHNPKHNLASHIFRQDMEVECDRFEAAKQETMSKYNFLDLPRGTLQQQADLCVDTLACLIGTGDAHGTGKNTRCCACCCC